MDRDLKWQLVFRFIRATPSDPPPKGAPGEGVGGPEGAYHQKSIIMSIVGFSIVRNSKMIIIYILGYPQPPQERPRGEGEGGDGVWRGV